MAQSVQGHADALLDVDHMLSKLARRLMLQASIDSYGYTVKFADEHQEHAGLDCNLLSHPMTSSLPDCDAGLAESALMVAQICWRSWQSVSAQRETCPVDWPTPLRLYLSTNATSGCFAKDLHGHRHHRLRLSWGIYRGTNVASS